VYTRARVPVPIAVLGGEIDVTTPEHKTLRLKLPPGTQSGQRFRLRGHGLPQVGKSDERGDLYASVAVEVPKTLSDEEKRLYEELRRLAVGG
jgi:DnaJ-class molecular chaperone